MPGQTKSRKKLHFFLLLSTVLVMFLTVPAGRAAAQSAWTTNDDAAHNVIWEEKLLRDITFLADSLCEGRATGSRGGNEAAFWIIRKFRDMGLLSFGNSYAKHVFAGGGIVGHNVVGMIPGSLKTPRRSYIVVGAHYDHLGILRGRLYPGADSNASGTVAMTGLAEMFAAMKTLGRTYGSNIIFVAFDANGMNLAGSQAFWRDIEEGRLTDPVSGEAVTPDKISLMVSLDQIGSTLSPLDSGREDYLIMLGNDSLPKEKRSLISLCNRFYDISLELSHTYYGSDDFTRIFYNLSDQRVFISHGIPSVLFTSGITMKNNKPSDTPETLNMPVLRKRIILIFHWLEKMM